MDVLVIFCEQVIYYMWTSYCVNKLVSCVNKFLCEQVIVLLELALVPRRYCAKQATILWIIVDKLSFANKLSIICEQVIV